MSRAPPHWSDLMLSMQRCSTKYHKHCNLKMYTTQIFSTLLILWCTWITCDKQTLSSQAQYLDKSPVMCEERAPSSGNNAVLFSCCVRNGYISALLYCVLCCMSSYNTLNTEQSVVSLMCLAMGKWTNNIFPFLISEKGN